MLPSLDIRERITDEGGYPSLPFHIWWQRFVDSQGSVNTELQNQIDAITGLDSSVVDVLSAAESSALAVSGVLSCTLKGVDSGSNAKVTVTAHTRHYGDGNTVAVNGGSILNLSYSTEYYIYYDQPSREGGAVQYFATTTPSTAIQVGDRHLVGKVTTPAALAADITGTTTRPPGLANLP